MSALLARARSISVIGLLLSAALGLLAATQPWGSVVLVDGRELHATGQQLAASLTLTALACAALALVLPIAGTIWRRVLGVLALVLGGATIAAVQSARLEVGEALAALVAEATGIAGAGQAEEVASLRVLGWPDAGVAAGALALLVGVWVLTTAHRWPARATRTARYERSGSGLAWDVMDDGEDPTR